MIIRTIHENDAEQFLNLCKQLDEETQFMLLEPGERIRTVEEQREQIRRLLEKENSTSFIVEHNAQLVGYLAAIGGEYKRNKHGVHIIIGILKAFTGQGIGTQLFQELERWACQKLITRLELTVMTHNSVGVALYRKSGFEVEGLRKHALVINGHYVDEYYMAKLLDT